MKEAIARIKKESELFQGEIQDFTTLMQIYRSAIKEVQTKLEILDDTFKTRYSHNPIHHIESRLKAPTSIALKLERRDLPMTIKSMEEGIDDIAGIRVICNYVEDIATVEELLLSQDDVTLLKRKDYITEPKENGYRSLHLLVGIPVYFAEGKRLTKVEVQLRTIAMDMWASLEHKLRYKLKVGEISEETRLSLRACSDELSRIDEEMQNIYREVVKERPAPVRRHPVRE